MSELCVLSFALCSQTFSSGVVPYLGTYLTVLTMLDTALSDTVEVSPFKVTNSPELSEVFFISLFLKILYNFD